MSEVTILTGAELRQCVALDMEAVEIVAGAFAALAGGGVEMPPILRLDIRENNGEVDVKTAFVPGLDGFAIKISPGFFDNPKLGLPSLNGLMTLFSARTGLLQAVLLDNGYLTDVRTAAAGAVAARHLAPARVATAAMVGSGLQARMQAGALALVREVGRFLVAGRDNAKAEACARDIEAATGVPAAPADGIQAALAVADVVVTTTPSRQPLIEAAWLHPGLHITAMGSDAADKNELAPGVLAAADRLVCDRRSQCILLGELHHAVAAGALPEDVAVTELGEIVAGQAPGRERDDQITVCDLTGTGVQDTAIACFAFRRAMARGMGRVIDSGIAEGAGR